MCCPYHRCCHNVPGCLTTADWTERNFVERPGRGGPRHARHARPEPGHSGYYAELAGLFVTHSQSDTLCGHILASTDHVSPPALPDQMFKRLGLTFCCGLEVTGWRAQLTQPLPSRTFCKIILFTSQISKLLLSPFKYRAGKIFSRKWKVLTDERRATYLVFTRYTQVMVMRLTSS